MDAHNLSEVRINLGSNEDALVLLGQHDQNLKLIEASFDVRIISRGNELAIQGAADEVEQAELVLQKLLELLERGHPVSPHEIKYAIRLIGEGRRDELTAIFSEVVVVTARGKPVRPKTLGQKEYVSAIRDNGITFGIGPAGTGKTYLAMAKAIAAFKNREVNRIILTRPAVEAGEKLGFLPGDLQDKVDPYLRPLYDALFDILGVETFQKYMERGLIEVAPLAYMRGRTLDDSFVILDEAQNTTPEQMKMFLTRLGFGSKAVITGDITQIDLPKGKWSGLEEVRRVLANVPGIAFVHLSERDVVRHELVQRVIKAYEEYEKERAATDNPGERR
ncbi:MAG: PhoH family protein [Bacillota bacterium]